MPAANPYVLGPLSRPQDFFGRDEIVDLLTTNLRRGVSVALQTPPRMGSTWLLSRMTFSDIQARLQGVMSELVFLDCSTLDHSGRLAQTSDTTPTPLDFYRRLAKLLAATHPEAMALLQNDDEDKLTIQVLDFISHSGSLWGLALDNFEALERMPSKFFDRLRSRILHGHLVLLVATHIDLNALQLPIHEDGSTFRDVLYPISLEPWSSQELDHFLKETSKRSGTDITDFSLSIDTWTGRIPGLVQEVAMRVFEAKQQGYVDNALIFSQALRNLAPHFTRQLQAARLSRDEQAVLNNILIGSSRTHAPQTQRILTKLQRGGFITNKGRVSSQLLFEFLRDHLLQKQ